MNAINAPRIVVYSAVRHKDTGVMVRGVRHGDYLNDVIRFGIDDHLNGETWECGFVDQDNKFMSREEAWKVADAAGQIRRPFGFEKDYNNQREPSISDEGLLFSENLY